MSDPSQAWERMHKISEAILRANSATEELERWCRNSGIGDGTIVALCERGARPRRLDDESLEALYPHCVQRDIRFRKVRLATEGIVVDDAVVWYFADKLTSDICRALETTQIPFGRAIKRLEPTRRTFLVRRKTPEQLFDADGSVDPASTAFEHRAVIYRADGAPVAVVHERFRAILTLRPARFCPMPDSADVPDYRAPRRSAAAGGFRGQRFDFDVVTDAYLAGALR